MNRLTQFIGLAGVDPNENPAAVISGRYFSIILIAAVVWLVFQWHLELKDNLSLEDAWFANYTVWSLFVIETAVCTLLVQNRWRYLKTNWLNIVIVIAGLPLLMWEVGPVITLLRVLRLILIFALISPWISLCARFLTDNRLDTTILAAFIILVLAGMLIAGIDPGIKSVEDGIWWAWVTVSTVGYGDMVPTTRIGKIFGGVLILVGMGLFSIITANFTALFVRRNAKKNQYMQEKWSRAFQELEQNKYRQEKILGQIKSMQKQMSTLGQTINQPPSSQ